MKVAEVARRLGHPADARLVVVHADDVGMCHGANLAFADLAGRGFITCGSAMVPCPWFLEAAELAAARPELDLGVHLTLTSEWKHYRWRPLTGSSKAGGLVDDDGYMWPSAAELRAHADPGAVEAELRAQIEAAKAAGIRLTHLDCHMGAVFAPELIGIYRRLGQEEGVPVLYTRAWNGDAAKAFADRSAYEATERELEARGNPLFENGYETPWVASTESGQAYARMLDRIEPGLTFLSLHPNRPGDIEAIDPPRCHCRTDEWRMFQEDAFLERVRRSGIVLIGFRDLQQAMRGAG
jgi:predicted glycoside hydrolase/deacetylase ChbG (UPF0249 family)